MIISRLLNIQMVLLALMLFSCKKSDIPTDEIIIPIVNNTEDTIVDPVKGVLLINENFQKWILSGYYQSSGGSCENYLMKSSNTVSYARSEVKVIYNNLAVNYNIKYFAINPQCGNDAGTSTLISDVSTGYVALQAPIHYKCFGHDLSADAQLATSVLPSVSVVTFSISYSQSDVDYMLGITLWKKGVDDSQFIKVKDFSILTNGIDDISTVKLKKTSGQVFSATINQKNVQLRFTCRWPDWVDFNTTDLKQLAWLKSDLPTEDPIINRAVRIHDLKVWAIAN